MPLEPGNEEKMADRHAVASGEDEKRHDENSMNDVHNGKRGPETASEERPEKFRKTVILEQDAPNTSSYSTMHLCPENPASAEKQVRLEQVLVQNSGHVDDDFLISAWDFILRDRWTKESLLEKKMPEISEEMHRMTQLRT